MMAGTFSTRDRLLPHMKLFISPFIWCVLSRRHERLQWWNTSLYWHVSFLLSCLMCLCGFPNVSTAASCCRICGCPSQSKILNTDPALGRWLNRFFRRNRYSALDCCLSTVTWTVNRKGAILSMASCQRAACHRCWVYSGTRPFRVTSITKYTKTCMPVLCNFYGNCCRLELSSG